LSSRHYWLPLLSHIERSAARLFLDTPYAFLVNDEPLSLDFVQQQFQAGRVWVAVDCHEAVVGYAIAREVDDTLYFQQIDVALSAVGLRFSKGEATPTPRLNYQLAITFGTAKLNVQRQEPYALIGCCGLRGLECAAGEMELGIELAPTYWGRYAYAIEVGRALLDFGFKELGLEVISGSTVSANARINRLAEWFGAEEVAIRPGASWMFDRGWNEVHWRITRERWEGRTARGDRVYRR
jgi:RimJ/RimL family protein N-acetyltransferase